VIPPEQLAGALERLDPRERELLALSLRRRVPDEALARVYDVVPQEVARRRAAAIERLADELGAQRGEDLGAVLQALLDEGTWRVSVGLGDEAEEPETDLDAKRVLEAEAERAAASAPPAEEDEEQKPEAAAAEPEPGGTETEPEAAEAEPQTPEPVAAADESDAQPDEPESDAAPPEPPSEPVRREPAQVEPHVAVVPVPTEPVLEMLAAREGIRGPEKEQPADADSRARRAPVVAAVLGSFAAAVIGGAAAFVGLSEWGDDGSSSIAAEPPANETMKHFVPELGGPFEAPFPSEPQPITCFSIASATGKITLYEKPGGKRRITLSPRTEWGSPRILGVVRRRGDWVSVQAPELGNGEVAWMESNRARLDCVRWSMHVDLSRRRLSVQRDGNTVRRFEIAVGRKGNPTPKGRFSVTDKLRVTDPGSPYGCCVLALTGHQTHLPASWPGGDRLAVHATRELSSLGRAASLGCMRVTSTQARWLIKTIPLGAPLFVRA
jgi:hypothetical protein